MQRQRRGRALHVARVIEVGLERAHERLVAGQQPAQPVREVLERGVRERRDHALDAERVPARGARTPRAPPRAAPPGHGGTTWRASRRSSTASPWPTSARGALSGAERLHHRVAGHPAHAGEAHEPARRTRRTAPAWPRAARAAGRAPRRSTRRRPARRARRPTRTPAAAAGSARPPARSRRSRPGAARRSAATSTSCCSWRRRSSWASASGPTSAAASAAAARASRSSASVTGGSSNSHR